MIPDYRAFCGKFLEQAGRGKVAVRWKFQKIGPPLILLLLVVSYLGLLSYPALPEWFRGLLAPLPPLLLVLTIAIFGIWFCSWLHAPLEEKFLVRNLLLIWFVATGVWQVVIGYVLGIGQETGEWNSRLALFFLRAGPSVVLLYGLLITHLYSRLNIVSRPQQGEILHGKKARTRMRASWSLILSATSLLTSFFGFVPGIVLGHLAYASPDGASKSTRGCAIAGMLIGYLVAILHTTVFVLLWLRI